MSTMIEAQGLSKRYGSVRALDGLSFSIDSGRIVGVIGRNGAGKTTALKAILGLTHYEGRLAVLGRDPASERDALMNDVCFIADTAVLPRWLRVDHAIEFVAAVHPRFERARAEEFLRGTRIGLRSRIGELSKVLLIYLAIFAPIAIATATGVRTVDPAKLRAAQSLGATRAQLIRHVILPSALPDILTGVRIGLGVGWSTLVAAELIAATSGLGFMVQSAAQFLVTDVVVLGILVIALIAFAMEMGLRALQRKWVPWHGQAH